MREVSEEAIDIDLNDPEVEAAATKIQAGFKGHKARQELKEKKTDNAVENSNAEEKVVLDSTMKEANEEAIDIDLNDPEVEAAATKIQAGFKGHRARKELKETKGENTVDGIVLDGEKVEEKVIKDSP